MPKVWSIWLTGISSRQQFPFPFHFLSAIPMNSVYDSHSHGISMGIPYNAHLYHKAINSLKTIINDSVFEICWQPFVHCVISHVHRRLSAFAVCSGNSNLRACPMRSQWGQLPCDLRCCCRGRPWGRLVWQLFINSFSIGRELPIFRSNVCSVAMHA